MINILFMTIRQLVVSHIQSSATCESASIKKMPSRTDIVPQKVFKICGFFNKENALVGCFSFSDRKILPKIRQKIIYSLSKQLSISGTRQTKQIINWKKLLMRFVFVSQQSKHLFQNKGLFKTDPIKKSIKIIESALQLAMYA